MIKRKFISILSLALLFFTAVPALAQRDSVAFQPHWYVMPQVGIADHIGEGSSFDKQLTPAASLSFGRQFSPLFGLRFGASGWQGRNWQSYDQSEYKWKNVQVNVDAVLSLSNLIAGFNPNRRFNLYGFLGGGLNIGFDNGEANDLAKVYPSLFSKVWDGTNLLPALRGGLGFDVAVSERVALGLEANANMMPDKWNSKKGVNDNVDWQMYLLAGVKIALGPTRRHIEIEEIKPVYQDPTPTQPKPEVKPQPKPKKPEVQQPKTTEVKVFFANNSSAITPTENAKILDAIKVLKANEKAVITITGYASMTGTEKHNLELSKERALAVKRVLVDNGIPVSRIKAGYKGQVDFGTEEASRVVIGVVE